MPHNEEGEFELVLGNKELLSLLFIVVVLLGVFFAMGFVVGRNSAPVESARASEPVRTNAPSAMPERRPQQQQQTSTPAQPSTDTAAPERPKLIDATPLSANQPQAGQSFLQVSAVAKAEAEILTELLVKKGFRAIIAPGPSDNLFRVLVGPAKDDADLRKTKSDLEQAGFKSIVRKY